MAFPQTINDIHVEFKFDGTNWVDQTPYVYTRDETGGIEITRGRSDWAERIDTGSCRMQLDNRDFRFSPRNPLGPYYGQIGRNTPVRVSVNAGDSYLACTGNIGSNTGASTPDSVATSITGDLDIRFEGRLDNWDILSAVSRVELCGKGLIAGNQRSWILYGLDNTLRFSWSADGITTLFSDATVDFAIPASGSFAVRVTIDVNNGAGGNTVTFYTAETIAGPWVPLGAPVVTAGTTSIFDSTAPTRVGDGWGDIGFTSCLGDVKKFQMRNGIDGTLVANPDFTVQTPGAGSFVDSTGLTWTVGGQTTISNKKVRFQGEVTDWPMDQDVSGNDVFVEIEAAGILRRLKANQQNVQSTLRRRIPSYHPIAYWPMEDGAESTKAASAVKHVPRLQLSPANWAAVDTLVSSDALPTISSGTSTACKLYGNVPDSTTNAWSVRWAARLDTPNATSRTFLRMLSSGSVAEWLVQFNSARLVSIVLKDDNGNTITTSSSTFVAGPYNQWVEFDFQVVKNGGNIDYHIGLIYPDGTANGVDFTLTTATFGKLLAVSSPDNGYSSDLDGMGIGHISVWDVNNNAAWSGAFTAWSGETTAERIARIGTEQNQPVKFRGDAVSTHTVGGQRTQPFFEIVQDAADVDGGILYETRNDISTTYRALNTMYNATPIASLDYPTKGHVQAPLRPVDDDQATKNDVTVVRTSASSFQATQDTGPLSVLQPPNGVGPYPDEITLKLETDDQCAAQAGWRLHLGTVDEARYPEVNVWLQHIPSKIESILYVDSGERMQITNPPGKFQYDTIDLMVQGYTEFISQYRWEFKFNCTPASPFDVASTSSKFSLNDYDNLGWADTEGSSLAEALTTTETDVDLITTTYPVWTSEAADYPFYLSVGGETIRADVPGTLATANPYLDTAITGWTGTNASVARSTAVVHPHPQAVATMLVTPAGGTATAEARNTVTATASVNELARYTASVWVYSPAGWNGFQPIVNWQTSAGAFISTSSGGVTTVPAKTWTEIEYTYTSPATASKAQLILQQANTPAATDIWYAWGGKLTKLKASAIYDEFARTSTDTWGNVDSDGAWTNTGGAAADYDVLTGFGQHTHPAASVGHHSTTLAPHADTDLYLDIATGALSTGASQFAGALARYTDVDNLYEARVEFTTAAAINLTLRKRVAAVETQLGTFATALTHVAGTAVRVRLKVTGTSLNAKIWATTELEPEDFNIVVTDSSITVAGSTGQKSVRNAGNTNANATFRFDNFDMINPQSFSTTRSVNGVVKAQTAGTNVQLRYPAITALT